MDIASGGWPATTLKIDGECFDCPQGKMGDYTKRLVAIRDDQVHEIVWSGAYLVWLAFWDERRHLSSLRSYSHQTLQLRAKPC